MCGKRFELTKYIVDEANNLQKNLLILTTVLGSSGVFKQLGMVNNCLLGVDLMVLVSRDL